MTNAKRKVEVSLMGQRFSVRTERDDEYVSALARYVGRQLDDVRKQTRAVSTHHLSLLVSLNLADQLFQREEELRMLKEEIRSKTNGILQNVNVALAQLAHPTNSILPDSHELDTK